MRLSIPVLLSAFLLGATSHMAFAQDSKRPAERSTTAMAAGSPLMAATPTRAAALPGDDGQLCLGFLEFEVACDAPVAHVTLLPPSSAQVERAAQVR